MKTRIPHIWDIVVYVVTIVLLALALINGFEHEYARATFEVAIVILLAVQRLERR